MSDYDEIERKIDTVTGLVEEIHQDWFGPPNAKGEHAGGLRQMVFDTRTRVNEVKRVQESKVMSAKLWVPLVTATAALATAAAAWFTA